MFKRTEMLPEQETERLQEQGCFQHSKQQEWCSKWLKNILSYKPCSCNILITLQSIVRYPNTVLSYDSYIFSVICDSEASKRRAAAPGRQPIYLSLPHSLHFFLAAEASLAREDLRLTSSKALGVQAVQVFLWGPSKLIKFHCSPLPIT